MTQHTYIPNGDSSYYLSWTPKTAGAHYLQVHDPVGSPDDDATYIYAGSYIPNGFPFDSYEHVALGAEVPDTDVINFIQIQHRGKSIGGNVNISCGIVYIPTGDSYGSGVSARYVIFGYMDFLSGIFYVNPRTAGAWTKSDINNFEIAIAKASTLYIARCTQIFLIVDHSPALAVIKHLLDGVIKPLA